MTATDQQIQLLHQIQNGAMPPLNAAILGYLLSFPLPNSIFPIEARLEIYHFIIAIPFISGLHLSPLWFTVLFVAFPPLFILSIILLIMLIKNTKSLPFLPMLFGRFVKTPQKAFLMLTFPHDSSKSAYATTQLYNLIHTKGKQGVLNGFLGQKKTYSLEIVSSRDEGIRFLLVVPQKEAEVMRHSLLSFLPGLKITEIEDYLTNTGEETNTDNKPAVGLVELKFSNDFALPLQNQNVLTEHDPIAFLTGAMTKPKEGELISLQIITTPLLAGTHNRQLAHMKKLRESIKKGIPLEQVLGSGSLPLPPFLLAVLSPVLWLMVLALKFVVSIPALVFDTSGKSALILQSNTNVPMQQLLNPYEQELQQVVKEKISQSLFESSIRILIMAKDNETVVDRADELISSFGQFASAHQSFETKGTFPQFLTFKKRLTQFKQRAVSAGLFNQNPILSTSEMADLYHFPYTDITKTEGLVKSKSRELPAPLSLKKSTTKFDVLIGTNQYGNETVPIGLTQEQRQKHTYVVGKTGTGKTTMLKNMIYQDILSGKGLAVLDPHGDLIKELLALIPKERIKDVIYFDPSDREYPIGINILSPGIKFNNIDDEHEWITSSVISVFLKLTPKEYWGHRLEHILRSATLTALQTPSPTLLTIQRLLTDKIYQKKISATLTDPVLKQFWEKEFKLFGSMQVAAAISPLTNRIGKFITTKMTRHILLQQKSTISIQKVMDEGKILLVNLSKGDLGEDVSFFFGTILTSFIQMAAYQRTKVPESKRPDFFLYIDEFQNFATRTFGELMSEGRKFHISLIPSHQNIAQIEDASLLETITANANTIICLNASPTDEAFILPYMQPEVKQGEIINLAPYQFFIKAKNEFSEDAFSGETIKLDVEEDQKIKDAVIANTRKHYGLPRKEVEEYVQKLFEGKEVETVKTRPRRAQKLSI